MRKILIIGGRIEPATSANVVCLYNIFAKLTDDFEIYFLGIGDKSKSYVKDGIKTYMMKDDCKNDVLKKSVLDIIHLPDTQPQITLKKTQYVTELNEEYHFDILIGSCSTYSNIYAALALKKAHPDMLAIGYYLDTIDSLFQRKGVLRKIIDKISYHGEKKVFKELDHIILPVSSKQIYEKKDFSNFHSKMHYLEFPTYIPQSIKERRVNENNAINMALFGSLNRTFRNPETILKILAMVSEKNDIKIELNVYGDSDKNLFQVTEKCQSIQCVFHGRVEHEALLDIISRADVLLNISNSSMTAVPSKIFEMFSSYRPILTYISDETDSALKYYKLYPECFIYNNKLTCDEQLNELTKFLKRAKTIKIDKAIVDELFIENNPSYVAERIKGLL